MNSPTIKALCLLIIAQLLGSTSLVQDGFAQETIVRSSTDPETSAALGQRVVLQIDVLGKDSWAQLPKLPTVEVPGAIVFVPPSQNLRLSETINGDSYTGQRYEWWIYPQNVGALEIPAVNVQVIRKQFGSTESTASVASRSDPHTVQVVRPDGVDAAGPLVATTSLKASQSWSQRIDSLSVGDGVTRTIVRVIRDAPSLVLPPIEFESPASVQRYVKQADTSDKIQRGELTGSRTDSVTYTFPESGTYQLPAIDVSWFDTESQTLRTETLEGRKVSVAVAADATAAPLAIDNDSDHPPVADSPIAFVCAAGFILAAICGLLFRQAIGECWSRIAALRMQTEAAFFRRFEASARSGDPAATLRELTRWSDKVQQDADAPRLIDLFSRYGTETDIDTLRQLQSAVADRVPRADMTELQTSTKAIRRQHQRTKNSIVRQQRSPLPPLRART